eukprot:CCRYP_018202-RA/>CCRYP_018202-RA protein AED:0.03 eAED:0.03 QI:220/1/1/1/0/0/2/548/330
MKVAASILLLAFSLATVSQARSTIRGLSDASSTPTTSATTYLPTYEGAFNETNDDSQGPPAEQPTPDEVMSVQESSTETTAPIEIMKDTPEAGLGTAAASFNETDDEPLPPARPERNDTMSTASLFSDGGDSNETSSLNHGKDGPPPAHFADGGNSNETSAVHDHGPKGPGLEQDAEGNFTAASTDDGGNVEDNARGPPAPPDFQALVDDKCASFDCSAAGNSTCPSPNQPSDRNATEDKGPLGPGKGPKRELKPGAEKPDPQELLACACCEGVTVEEFNSTGVDVSGLAFLVGYNPSAATLSDNSANLNSLVFSSSFALVATAVLVLFV